MAEAADVTIVIVNWNAGPWLDQALQAVADQTRRPAAVLVVDNASTDGSADGLEARFPGVRLLRAERNLGFAAANNRALAAADTRWVALLNPDARPRPDWLERLLAGAARHPDCRCFASLLLDAADPARLDGAGDAYHVSGLAWRRGHGAPLAALASGDREVFAPCAAAALYEREAVLAAGGFDEGFFCYFEDVDLAFRLRLAGERCLLIPDARVAHVGSATTGGQHSEFALYHGHRNLVWTYVKNMPAALLWPTLPAHLLLNLATVLVFALRGRGRVILRSKRDALRGLPAAWRARRRIQARRRVPARALWRVMDKGLRP